MDRGVHAVTASCAAETTKAPEPGAFSTRGVFADLEEPRSAGVILRTAVGPRTLARSNQHPDKSDTSTPCISVPLPPTCRHVTDASSTVEPSRRSRLATSVSKTDSDVLATASLGLSATARATACLMAVKSVMV